ncbi:alpha/beta fold hydrolase [Nitriliruptor alkaliphilus]|uniref:alpha/beta fold hydrolase n=1 Tax=Nitriliruptor alkaliphilus TaxID=427918 RepID=UPI0006983395|nr:alpha/beta fold hydrolase [Nitriliruptor alkaliphilus]
MGIDRRPAYVDTEVGRVHLVAAGPADGEPVFLLHQTPRSCDEYREVLGVLGRHRRCLALDTLGYGASAPPVEHTIEAYAAGVLAVAAALGVDRFDVVGHHTGGAVAVEVAASAPAQVRRLVLSSTSYIDAAARAARQARPHALDAYTSQDDGSHLLTLWRGREPYYPAGHPRLRDRYLRDALRADDPAAGHRAVAHYEMERRLPLVTAPTWCVVHEQDPHAMPSQPRLVEALGAEVLPIPDGHVPLEYTADAFAAALLPVLAAG